MNLTEYFYSLPHIDKAYNKYAAYSLAFNNPYRLITGYDVYRYDKLDAYFRSFVSDNGKCIVMPNIFNGEVVGLVVRSITSKQFRYHSECKYIPYGAGVNYKPFYKPWVIVESALDSDFLRNFYPFVIATNGVSVSADCMNFLKGTSSTIYCAFDNDTVGNEGFHKICMKHSGSNKEFHIKRLCLPSDLCGTKLKDYGDVLEFLFKKDSLTYDSCVSYIKFSLMNL